MKRALAFLLALTLAQTAWAGRVLVVVHRSAEDIAFVDGSKNVVALREQSIGSLNALGVDYDVVPNNIAATLYCRTGVMTYNYGTSAAFTKSYDAVIHILDTQQANAPGSCRVDSMFHSAKYPQVPQLIFTRSYNWVTGTSCCSTAVQKTSGGYNGGANWQGTTSYLPGYGYPRRLTNLDGYRMNGASPVGSIVRGLVYIKTNADHAQAVLPTDGAPAMWPDSLLSGFANGDTAVMYSVQHNITGAKPLIVCDFSHNAYDQSDPSLALAGIAALDSAAGGVLITKPLKLGLYISGGLRRSNRVTWGGISPDDSANFKASMDSLATLGVPITVGISVSSDTLTNRESDFAWYRRVPMASYSPESWLFVNDTTLTGPAQATSSNPIDIFGRYRKRAQFGDSLNHAVVGIDSSIAQLVRGSFSALQTLRLPIDRGMVPPLFDHVPIKSGTEGDSAYYGAFAGGARAIVFDINDNRSYGAQSNQKTRVTRSSFRRVGSGGGQTMLILGAVTMAQDSSAARWTNGMSTDGYSFVRQWGASVESFWDSAVGAWPPKMATPVTPAQSGGGRASDGSELRTDGLARVFVTAASDFGSGTRSDASTRPTRPGWLAVKSIVNAARQANSFCWPSKRVVVFDKLENLAP